MINYLGADVFSRNIYCRQDEYWFGGICDEYFEGGEVVNSIRFDKRNKLTAKEYRFDKGKLSEELLYVFDESTIVQKKFLITDYKEQGSLLEQFVASRKWKFNREKFEQVQLEVGDRGIVIAGEFFSPLKMLHLTMGPVNSVYFLMEQPEFAAREMKMTASHRFAICETSITGRTRTAHNKIVVFLAKSMLFPILMNFEETHPPPIPPTLETAYITISGRTTSLRLIP
jgi:hypothetical protein